jgi:hypothetical protein
MPQPRPTRTYGGKLLEVVQAYLELAGIAVLTDKPDTDY